MKSGSSRLPPVVIEKRAAAFAENGRGPPPPQRGLLRDLRWKQRLAAERRANALLGELVPEAQEAPPAEEDDSLFLALVAEKHSRSRSFCQLMPDYEPPVFTELEEPLPDEPRELQPDLTFTGLSLLDLEGGAGALLAEQEPRARRQALLRGCRALVGPQ